MTARRLGLVIALVALPFIAWAQQTKSTRVCAAGDVVCLPSAPTTVMLTHSTRQSYFLINNSTVSVRVGWGTGAAQLSAANAQVMPAGSGLTDGTPSVSILQVSCQSVGTSSVTVTFTEFCQ